LGESAGEQRLAGFFKHKKQDVSVAPNNVEKKAEILRTEGILYGEQCSFGQEFTERMLSINVRSQLSSISKNFDTLYERTFAEALNLHLRCPRMVLGELYMIAVTEYDSRYTDRNQIVYKRPSSSIKAHIQKYLLSFSAVNDRANIEEHHYKYERACLLIVDFSKDTPKVYNTDEELRADGLLSRNSIASIENLSFPTFIPDLLNIYTERFGAGRFI
jgi:hypothetical protein